MIDRSRWLLGQAALFVMLGCTVACSSASDEGDEDAEAVSAEDATAILDLHPLDIWGQPLPAKETELTILRDGKRLRVELSPSIKIYLGAAAHYDIKLSAPNHEPLQVSFDFDGGDGAQSLKAAAPPPAGAGLTIGRTQADDGGRKLAAHEVFLGLRHQWFSAQGRPARRGNDVKLMMDGEESWSTVYKDIKGAKQSINAATWWWESNFELLRPEDPNTPVAQRMSNTIFDLFEASPATKRVIVGQFWGQDSILSWVNTDSALRGVANTPNDKFEFMGQANETRGAFLFNVAPFTFADRVKGYLRGQVQLEPEQPIASTVPSHQVDLSAGAPIAQDWFNGLLETASYHQKFMTIDTNVAFVGGMNLRQNDWDTSSHKLYEPRRAKIEQSSAYRDAVAGAREITANPPRKDYMVRIDGPSAQDVNDVFRERWEFLRNQKVSYSQYATPFDVQREIQGKGATQLQVTATLPAPFNEAAIAETWFNAVRNAKKYIYVEDQYFRIPLLNDAIVKRMQEVPDLKLIVITMAVEKTNPACAPSRKAYGTFKSQFPDRAFFFQLRTFDNRGAPSSAYAEIDTHSKMLMVDDVFLSVGSCNKNNRGIIYEGEMNVAIVDPALVGDARKRIMSNILATQAGDDWIAKMVAAAAHNDQLYGEWAQDNARAATIRPEGFVHSLSYPRLDDCYLMSIGPDRT